MPNYGALKQAMSQEAQGRGNQVVSMPAPIMGWNQKDGEDAMDPLYARELDNWYPDEGKLTGRLGFAAYSTGIGSGEVETLIEFNDGPQELLLAAGGGAIYDISASGAGVSKATGFTSNRWQGENFVGKLGLVNGADAPQIFDGSTVTGMTVSGTGLTTTDLIGVIAYKSRSYFWEISSGSNPRSFWYSALGTMGGTLTEFNLGTKAGSGGYIVAAAIWSRDAGNTMDDLLAFFMSTGKVLIYSGSNPGDTADWSLVGDYKTGHPLGPRCIDRLGGEVIIGTRSGYLPLSGIIQGGKFEASALSDIIRGAVKSSAAQFKDNFGWEINVSDDGGRMMVNVPASEGETYHQHVVNLVTGAWCRFTDVPSRCWANFAGNTYFGAGGGTVKKFDTGYTDEGVNRDLTGAQAYSRLGSRGYNVQVTGIAPYIASSGALLAALGVDVDFRNVYLPTNIYSFAPAPTAWEEIETLWEAWDEVFSDAPTAYHRWFTAKGNGGAIAPRMTMTTDDNVEWYATSISFELGGVL
jgi:hypothetical protein